MREGIFWRRALGLKVETGFRENVRAELVGPVGPMTCVGATSQFLSGVTGSSETREFIYSGDTRETELRAEFCTTASI